MGLDMYLEEDVDLPWNAETELIVNGKPWPHSNGIEKFTRQIGYWRKANQIHSWFCNKCDDGRDDCKRIYVSHDHIRELYNLCVHLLESRDEEAALKKLPPQEGFFFGSSDPNADGFWNHYWQDLENTVEILKPIAGKMLEQKITKDNDFSRSEFFYQASW